MLPAILEPQNGGCTCSVELFLASMTFGWSEIHHHFVVVKYERSPPQLLKTTAHMHRDYSVQSYLHRTTMSPQRLGPHPNHNRKPPGPDIRRPSYLCCHFRRVRLHRQQGRLNPIVAAKGGTSGGGASVTPPSKRYTLCRRHFGAALRPSLCVSRAAG